MNNPLEDKKMAIQQSTEAIGQDVKALKIFDENSEARAIDLLSQVSVRLKRIEELRVEATKPLVDQKRAADNLAKMFSEPLTAMQHAIKAALKEYMDAKARAAEEAAAKARAEQEEKERIEREKLAEARRKEEEAKRKEEEIRRAAEQAKSESERRRLEEQAKEAERKAAEEAAKAAEAQKALDTKEIVMVEEAPKSVRTASGAMATRKLKWVWEVTDFAELLAKRPDLLIIDETKVNGLVKGGEREIPGIRIYQESEIASRS